jgi:hypothetical protein
MISLQFVPVELGLKLFAAAKVGNLFNTIFVYSIYVKAFS